MKNKIITIIIVAIFSLNTIANASTLFAPEKTTSTAAGSWKDPSNGRKFYNGGSATFRFKKSVTYFEPWMEARSPSISAGCGGVSLDGGFASFLNLKKIGDQLEQAVSSVGTGVIVVLLQTMPSIAKAFEDVQKIVRKIQSLLANACQATTALIKNTDTYKSNSGFLQEAIDNHGLNYFDQKSAGIETQIDNLATGMKCNYDDKKCLAGLAGKAVKPKSDIAAGGMFILGGSKELGDYITISDTSATKDDACPIYYDTIAHVLQDKKFAGRTLGLSQDDSILEMVKIALFGVLAVDKSNTLSLTNVLKPKGANKYCAKDGKAGAKEIATSVKDHTGPSTFALEYVKAPSVNTDTEIINFLTGDDNGTTNSLKYYTDFKYYLYTKPDVTTENLGGKGPRTHRVYFVKDSPFNENHVATVSWKSIQSRTLKTMMHYLDKANNPAEPHPVDIYIPNGGDYLEIIKKYANPRDYRYYAQELSRINTKYAVKNLISQAKNEAISNISASTNSAAINQYIESVKAVAKKINKNLDNYSGDFGKLNELDDHFQSIKRKKLEQDANNKR